MKKEYLQKICDKLNQKGLTEYDAEDILSSDRRPFSAERGEVKSLWWLPEDNLSKIAEYDISKYTDYAQVYQAWGREGFFKFKPYIVGRHNTTMCLRHNRFLHMFRGYYFQVSGTPDGEGEYEKGLCRTDGFVTLLSYDNIRSKSHLGFIVLYASMIDCAFHIDSFRELFYNNRDEVDEYFRQSMKFWNINFSYGFDTISQYVTYRDGYLTQEESGHQIYYIEGKGGILCRFWVSPNKVEVEYCYDRDSGVGSSRIISFDIPSPLVGIDDESINKWDEDDRDDFEQSFFDACSSYEKVHDFVLLMLLKFIGIHSNYMGTYPIKKLGFIRNMNDESAIKMEKFDQIVIYR